MILYKYDTSFISIHRFNKINVRGQSNMDEAN